MKKITLLSVLGILSGVICIFHIVYYNYGLFEEIPHIEALMWYIFKLKIFENLFLGKLIILFLAFLAGLGYSANQKINMIKLIGAIIITMISFLVSHVLFSPGWGYIVFTTLAFVLFYMGCGLLGGYLSIFSNIESTSISSNFMQCTKLIENENSINIPTRFKFHGREYKGWINVVNPFRASIVLGLPGSGKSFVFYNNYIEQMIKKQYTMFLYDRKYPDLTIIVYNMLLKYSCNYKISPKQYVINFDDPEKTHRANPLNPKYLDDIIDAYEAAYMVMINLNKTWIQKQGDFFVESAIVFFTAIIWYLKLHDSGKFCTLPHAIELLMQPYQAVFEMLKTKEEIRNYLTPFINAMEGGAQDQLQGQIASAQIPLTRLSSPTIYWAMSGDDFTLDINNPEEPKIVCIGNNPDRENIYAAALSLYNTRIFKIINKPGRQKCGVLIDELPTIYIRGLDGLIATARSNEVAIFVGAQDLSQLTRDYGEKEAEVIFNTIGNVFAGQVRGKTAKIMSEGFGKAYIEKQSVTHSENNSNSVNVSTQLEDIIPASVISSLSQGSFVGQVADNFDQKINEKFFHAELVMNQNFIREMKNYKNIPILATVDDSSTMKELVYQNYKQIKEDIKDIISPYL